MNNLVFQRNCEKADSSKQELESLASSKLNFVFASTLHSLSKVHKMEIIKKSLREKKLIKVTFKRSGIYGGSY